MIPTSVINKYTAWLAIILVLVVTTITSYDSFHDASVIMFGNAWTLTGITVLVIAAILGFGVVAYPRLEREAQVFIDYIYEDFVCQAEEAEDDGKSGDDENGTDQVHQD